MAEQQKLSLCPRLVDYLAIVGARTTPPVHKGLQGNKTPPVQVNMKVFKLRALDLPQKVIFYKNSVYVCVI